MSTNTPLIYLASPYSHPDAAVRERRFREVAAAAGRMMRTGIFPFSPIAHTHPIAVECDLPKGWDFWERFDRAFIARCSELWVLTLDGWQDSKGVTAETAIAHDMGLIVSYWDGSAEDLDRVAESFVAAHDREGAA